MIVMPATYSPNTVARSFTLVDEFELSGRVLHVIYDSQTPRAAIIEADIETFDGVPRHRVVAALDLQHKAHLGKDMMLGRYSRCPGRRHLRRSCRTRQRAGDSSL